jgi:uncharacterized SAM-binding protein YcdF (DUF218 family)
MALELGSQSRIWLRRVTLGSLGGFFLVMTVLSSPIISKLLIGELETIPAISRAELATASRDPHTAIVILAAGRRSYAPEYSGETIDALSLERVRYGALLARATGLPVLVSGGLGGTRQPSLAELMAKTLSTDYGIQPRWLETRSTNTAENAIFSSELLRRQGVNRVVLVTHAWHMRRARLAFLANGTAVIAAPTAFYRPQFRNFSQALSPSFEALQMSGYALHEIVGQWWYALRYGY